MSERERAPFTVDQAVALATEAHREQVDKGGNPYIEHPIFVMGMLQGDESQMAGVLHDVIEDTEVTLEDLRVRGVPDTVVEAVGLVTHDAGFDGSSSQYLQKIEKIAESGNQIAIDVKWADLTHNSDLSRMPVMNEKTIRKRAKYQIAKSILRPVVSSYLREE